MVTTGHAFSLDKQAESTRRYCKDMINPFNEKVVNENKIRLRKVGIFSQQMGHPVTDLFKSGLFLMALKFFPLKREKKVKPV